MFLIHYFRCCCWKTGIGHLCFVLNLVTSFLCYSVWEHLTENSLSVNYSGLDQIPVVWCLTSCPFLRVKRRSKLFQASMVFLWPWTIWSSRIISLNPWPQFSRRLLQSEYCICHVVFSVGACETVWGLVATCQLLWKPTKCLIRNWELIA